jgi:PAS domain S-box-containing protein
MRPDFTNRRGAQPPQPPPAGVLLSSIIDSSDDAIMSVDLEGTLTSWNKAAEKMLGYPAAEAIGMSCLNLVTPEQQPQEVEILKRVAAGDRIEHFEATWVCRNGGTVEISVTLSPIRSPDGTIIGASKVARDISEQKRGNRADLLLAAIVSSSDDAIVSKNLDGIITSWNEGARRIFGYTAEEMIGQPVLKLVPVDRKDEEPRILERLGRGERVDHFETIRVRKDGEQINVSLTISPVRDHTGRIMGASKIARDITHLKRTAIEHDQLLESERAARSQAEHANRMKDEFLATVSHELRTPLNAIVGWTEILKGASSLQEVAEGVAVIERNALVQAQLIDDLLDLGRISAGKMALNVEQVDISAIVREAIASVQHAADTKHITIKAILHDIRGRMMGDVKRLRQVIWNLLTNAIKFTPNQGRVFVTVSRVNSHIDISVADNGRGIPAEFLPHVFERFRQADASITRQHGGLGIGLALVKQLVELHAGNVHAASPGVGQGSTFTVTLPVMAAHDHDSLDVVRRILIARNAEVQAASSAEQALEEFKANPPDVILSDIGMPGHDGYELIKRIRELPKGTWVPAAALTALARSEDRMRALRAGFQTHVSKPVAAGELVAVVRSLASVHRP